MKRKERFFGILLGLVLMLTLMPGMSLTANAYDGNPYASLVNKTTAVTFDGKTWYIIEDNSTAVNAGTVTLLAKECVAESQYNASGSFVAYESNPTVKTAVVNWYNDNITDDAKTAVSGGGMFLLTIEEANAITNAEVRKDETVADGGWWLCSQGDDVVDSAAFVDGESGDVDGTGLIVMGTNGVRPALKLDLSKVTFDSASNTFAVGAAAPALDPVSYLAWDESAQALVEKTGDDACKDYTVVTADTTEFANGGWYVVKPGESAVTNDNRIEVNGTANLILMDGATHNANAGITVTGDQTLNIYAQSTENAGTLNAGGSDDINGDAAIGGRDGGAGGNVNIHGGMVNATGFEFAAGIGSGQGGIESGSVTVYGGTVTAIGGEWAAGIGGGNSGAGGTVNIHGGTVTAIGGEEAAGIGKGYDGSSSGTVTIGEGMSVQAGDDEGSATVIATPSSWAHTERWVHIEKAEAVVEYPLWVGGVQVTSANASDVLGAADGDGATVSFTPAVEDDPETTTVDESAPATLTLSGANITTGHEYISGYSFAGICYEGTTPLTIELASDTNNTIDIDDSQQGSNGIGFYTEDYNPVDLILTGEGSLTTKATGNGSCGINVSGSITINSGVVTAESVGQYAAGMNAKNVTIKNGTVTVAGTGEYAFGISALEGVMIEDGEVTVTGSASAIYTMAMGGVKNAIAGTGWTDVDGTEGATAIAVSSESQDLNSYKRLQFPPLPYDVSITAGAGMTKTTDSGAASQTGLTGAMTGVVYTANAGYYFPTNYSVDPVNGISVTRNSSAQITVSGTPTADVTVTIPDAVSIPSPVVINSSNFSDYFDENGVLRYIVPEESVLDFRGEFKGEQYNTITINKKVTVTSTSDPTAKFNGTDTENNVVMTFNTVAGADYTTISNLEFLNCRLDIQGVTHVTVDNINLSVKDKRVGSGTGALTIWGGANDATVSYVVVKNSHFECSNNGGSSCVGVGRGADHITFENNTAEGSGNIGNMFNVTPYNLLGATTPGYVTFKDNNIEKSGNASAISYAVNLCGEGHVLEGNTIKWQGTAIGAGYVPTPTNCTFKNNTVINGDRITIYSFSTAEGNITDGNVTVSEGAVFTGNTVGGTLTVSGKDTQIKENTVNNNVTINGSNTIFENNDVTGIVTVGRASKGNSLTENTVVSTEDYAVILQSTAADSNTSVENNTLISKDKLGDDAVNPGKGSGNKIQNNNNNGYTALQDEWIQPIADMTYTGAALEPEVVVMNGSTALILGTDYQVAYKDNQNAGTATVTVTRAEGSSYGGKAEKTFTVNKAPAPTTITPAEEQKPTARTGNDMVYTGSALALVTAPASYPDPYTGVQYSTDGGTTWSDQIPTGTAAGGYTVKVKYTSANFNDLAGEDVAVTIAKAPAPDVGTITEAQKPTARTGNDVDYTGSALALVTAPASYPDPYTGVQYSTDGGTTWSDQIPTGTAAGGYTVKVKYTSANYNDLAGEDVAVTIAKVAPTVTAPTAKTLSYTGEAQELVTAGTATGGTMQYSLDGVSYSEAIPTGTAAGSYYVWYKIVGDENHNDTAAECAVTVIVPVFGPATFILPASTKTVGESAFEGLPMTVVDIPEGCTSIGANAFKDCANLTQIRIPASVTSIDTTAFDGCVGVFIYGTINSTAQIFCGTHDNCTFVAEN